MTNNRSLKRASLIKTDEFYTQLSTVEDELVHYRKHFAGKTVLCNADDPFESNFFKYFVLNFNRLKLKKLIATCYDGSPIEGDQLSLFDVDKSLGKKNKPYKAVVTKVYDKTGNGSITMDDIKELFKSGENKLTELKGNGDYKSPECLKLLDEADIVCTNPPFSKIRAYINVLMRHHKQFLIIGNENLITYKEMFPLLENNQMWLGYHAGHTWFSVPASYKIPDFYDKEDTAKLHSNGYKIDKKGHLWRNLGNICWLTNLDINKRHENIVLFEHYTPQLYPKYDNYNAIEVNTVSEIPVDYKGVMGVPVTFLNKYNPEQFEILGLAQKIGYGLTSTKTYDDYEEYNADGRALHHSGHKINGNPILVGKPKGRKHYFVNADGRIVYSAYARIFIKNKHPERSDNA